MQQAFLRQLAEAFHSAYGSNVSRYCFVFPNRRAGLFFQHYLAEVADKPLFSPRIETISSFYESLYPQVALEDRLGLLFRLYRCYHKHVLSTESFDDFVWLGETLLSDFNDIDNHMVNARNLFANLSDLSRLGNEFPFSEEQVEAINHFWTYAPKNDDPDHKHQRKFYDLWSHIYTLYVEFGKNLIDEGLAYSGMLHRLAVENIKTTADIPYERVVFIGFSTMSEADRQLFSRLQELGKADFYWDYVSPAIQDPANRASHSYLENSRMFPSTLALKGGYTKPKVHCVAVSSDVGQVKYAYEVLKQLPKVDLETAVVLADENLLVPMLSSVPPTDALGREIELNVTMSYPLKNSTVFQLLDACISMQRDADAEGFWFAHVLGILQHPQIQKAFAEDSVKAVKRINKSNVSRIRPADFANTPMQPFFVPCATKDICKYLLKVIDLLFAQAGLSSWDHEFMLQCERELKRIDGLLEANADIELSTTTLQRLLRALFSSATASFAGEPLKGLQLMGMLETRSLDFDKIIICSFGEGYFPKNTTQVSLIPYELRRSFKLPTSEYQDAIFAYHFYHLLERCSEIWLVYNSESENKGEESRYIKQLRMLYADTCESIDEQSVAYAVGQTDMPRLAVDKTGPVMQQLYDRLRRKPLSASSLDTWLTCRLKFYYSFVLGLKEPDETEEFMNAAQKGSILHETMQRLYAPYLEQHKVVGPDSFSEIESRLEGCLQEAVRHCYFNNGDMLPLSGFNRLTTATILDMAKATLSIDKQIAPFTVTGLEQPFEIEIDTANPDLDKVRVKGYIDRIDQCGDRLRICDYKTGKADSDNGLDKYFDRKKAKFVKEQRQLMLYLWAYRRKHQVIAEGHLYHPAQAKAAQQSTLLLRDLTPEDMERFEEMLRNEIANMLHPYDADSPNHPENSFSPSEDCDKPFGSPCRFCPFKVMCNQLGK